MSDEERVQYMVYRTDRDIVRTKPKTAQADGCPGWRRSTITLSACFSRTIASISRAGLLNARMVLTLQ